MSGACRPAEKVRQSLRPASRTSAPESRRADCVIRHSASTAARGRAEAFRWAWSAQRAGGGSRPPPRHSIAAGAGCAAAAAAAVAAVLAVAAAAAAAIRASQGRLPSEPVAAGPGI